MTTDKRLVWQLFNNIAPSYDRANRILSFGQDIIWRKRVKAFLPQGQGLRALDLATGTGDLLAEIARSPRVNSAVGLDMAQGMLDIASTKYAGLIHAGKIELLRGDATKLPFSDESFNVVSIAFGIRNVANHMACINEMHRVLIRGGRLIVLEFSLPRLSWLKSLYLWYFRRILPKLGGLISGNFEAYSYLNSSVESFPYGKEFTDMLAASGFTRIMAHPLSFGVATIYVGERDCE